MKSTKQTASHTRSAFLFFSSAAIVLYATLARADQVILDDLIVDGSICVGLDCVNGESFGFDTLRLKENNLRIKFFDTSNSASFPTNDWQITANESSNGGLEKFSIDDISGGRIPFTIEAGAPSHSLYTDDGGRIGFGTNSPVVELHVKDGDTPTLRLEQDGSSGFTPQTWDVAGNETNFFIRDATTGSRLPFRIRPAAPSNSLFIDTDGDVGLGTSSPGTVFHVSRSGLVLPLFESSNNDAVQLRLKSNSENRRFLALNASDTVQSQIVFGNSEIQLAGTAVPANLFATFNSDGMDVNGTISLNGSQVHPDYVFESNFDLETIDEHAAYMWEEKHLPAVGPGTYNPDGTARIDLAAKTMGMLEELEKAHIYIEQLHNRLNKAESENSQLQQRLEALESRLVTSQ